MAASCARCDKLGFASRSSAALRPPQAPQRSAARPQTHWLPSKPRCGRQRRRCPSPLAAASGGDGNSLATAQQQQQHAEASSTALIDWLVSSQGAEPSCLKVERRYGGPEVGWCLVATAEIEPEEVILSVPLPATITSEGADESRWSAAMAAQLLQRRQAAAAAAAGDSLAAARAGQPWLDALPAHVDLPWLYWSEAELAELQEEDTVAEAMQFRAAFEAACQELGGAHPREDVAWAMSLVHSRSFVEASVGHIWAPGIDMCNHTLQPNADIRCVHSPGSCQGGDALEEVCPPETAAAHRQEPGRLELVAGEAGIGRGEEVTISYGSWPSDVFLLFFGFAPEDNPNDSAVLFYDLFDLASFKLRSVDLAAAAAAPEQQQQQPDDEEAMWQAVELAVRELEELIGPAEQFVRMVATANGLDARLMHAAQALLSGGRGSPDGRPMSLPEFLRLRCQQLLARYPTTLEEDEALLRQLEQQRGQQQDATAAAAGTAAAEGLPRLGQLLTAVRYRAGKKRVLHSTLAAMTPQQQQ